MIETHMLEQGFEMTVTVMTTLAVMSTYPVLNVVHLFFDITIPQSFRYMNGLTQYILYENMIFFLTYKGHLKINGSTGAEQCFLWSLV